MSFPSFFKAAGLHVSRKDCTMPVNPSCEDPFTVLTDNLWTDEPHSAAFLMLP